MRWHETQTLYNLADSELVFTALAVIFLAVYLSSDRMNFHATCTGTKCVCVTGLVKFKMCQIQNVSNYKIRSDAVNLFDCSDCYSGAIMTTDKSQILSWHRVQWQSKTIFKGMTSFRKLLTFGPLFYLWMENHWRKYLKPWNALFAMSCRHTLWGLVYNKLFNPYFIMEAQDHWNISTNKSLGWT